MKVVRTYKIDKDWLRCTCDYVLDTEDDFTDDTLWCDRWPIYLKWKLSYSMPKNPQFDSGIRICCQAHPNVPQDAVLKEMAIFIQTIKQMYEL